jgi:hypothetical protein
MFVGGGDHAEVVHAGRWWQRRAGLGYRRVGVPADEEGGGHPGRVAGAGDLDDGEVFGVVAQLDAAADQRRVEPRKRCLPG